MRGPVQAMLWELWRTSRFELLFYRLSLPCAYVMMMYLSARNLSETVDEVLRGVTTMMLTIPAIFSQSWLSELDDKQGGFSFRLGFVRPASTRILVTVPLTFIVLTSVACYLIPAALFGWLMQVRMPLYDYALIVAVIATCGVSVVWAMPGRSAKLIALAALCAGLGTLFSLFAAQQEVADPILILIGRPEFFGFSWLQSLLALLTIAIVTSATIFAVDQQRHGEGWTLAGLFRSRPAEGTTQSCERHPFPNALAAQFWYEWRRFGQAVVIFGAVAPLVLILFLIAGTCFYGALRSDVPVWLFALALSPFVYQLVGADGAIGLQHIQGNTRLSLFDATRSMTNSTLIAIKLLVIAASSWLGWLCMVLMAGLHTLLTGKWHDWSIFFGAMSDITYDRPWFWWSVIVSNLVFGFISGSSGLLAFGMWAPLYPFRLVSAFVLLIAHALLLIWDAKHGWRFQILWTAYGYVLAIAIAGACLESIRKAMSSGTLSRQQFSVFGGLWLISASSMIATCVKLAPKLPFEVPFAGVILAASLLLVPLATTAFAPMAFSAHRHGK